MKSILQKTNYCYICGAPTVELHHIFFGTKDRKVSDHEGFTVLLCPYHHRGPKGPHLNREADLWLKRKAQAKYEETHTREEFMALIGRGYLWT